MVEGCQASHMWFQGGAVLPHAAAAAAARVQEKQRHSENLALKHGQSKTRSDRKILSIPRAARARATTRNTLCWGHSSFRHSSLFTHTPLQVTRTGMRIIALLPLNPGLGGCWRCGRESGDRKSSWGQPNEAWRGAWFIRGRAQAIRSTETASGLKMLGSSPSAHLDAKCTILLSTPLAGTGASGTRSTLKPRQKQTQHDRRAARQLCIAAIATLPQQGIGARGFLDLGDLHPAGHAISWSSGLGPGPIGEYMGASGPR